VTPVLSASTDVQSLTVAVPGRRSSLNRGTGKEKNIQFQTRREVEMREWEK
jgi:hypothetical protein